MAIVFARNILEIRRHIYGFLLILFFIYSLAYSLRLADENPCQLALWDCPERMEAAQILDRHPQALIVTSGSAEPAGFISFWETIIACNNDSLNFIYKPDNELFIKIIESNDFDPVFLYDMDSSRLAQLANMPLSIERSSPRIILLNEYAEAMEADRSVLMDDYSWQP
jgi:hypothetical protein